MKKKMIVMAFCLVIAFVGAWLHFSCLEKQKMEKDLTLANVEALTQGDYPSQGLPMTNWKKYSYACSPKTRTTTKTYKISATTTVPKGATIVKINGELYYQVAVTEKYTPIITVFGSGIGNCYISESCM